MRVTLAIIGVVCGLFGAYLVGAGTFGHEGFAPNMWDVLGRPFSSSNPIPCLVLALSVALAFFGLAVASDSDRKARAVQLSHIFLWGGLFSVLTAAGFAVLLFVLWQQGASSHNLGLVFSLAVVQACLGVVLGGGATITGRGMRHVTVPVFVAAILETALAGAVVAYGFSV